jgi:hypothetical protein
MFINRFLDLIPHNPLSYLKFIDIAPQALNIFLKTVFPKLTKLISLNITNSMTKYPADSLLEIINYSLPAFKHLSLSIKQYPYSDFLLFTERMLLHQIKPALSTVTHLSLEHTLWDITGLFYLFEMLNKIECLQITLDIDDETACAIGGPFILDSQLIRNRGENLRSLIIRIEFRLLFPEIASLLNHFPQLRKLSLATQRFTHDVRFYDGQKWEQLIQTSLPRLTSFRLYIFLEKNGSDPFLHTIVDLFRTSFWLNEKKWYIVCDKFTNGSIQLYTVPCPKNIVVNLNIISTAWDTTLPSFNTSTFDCVTSLRVNATEGESNPMTLPYFNNVKSIGILALPNKDYHLSRHMNLSKLELVTCNR